MKVRRQVDEERGVVRLTFEFPIHIDPDRAADQAWEHTARQIARVQHREARAAGTAPTGLVIAP